MAPKRPSGAGAFPKPVESPAPKKRPNPTDLYAALDLGTNSCRMLIAQPKGNQFHVVDSFSKSVQLGAGLERTGRLNRGSMQRTVQALRVPTKTEIPSRQTHAIGRDRGLSARGKFASIPKPSAAGNRDQT